MYRIHFYILVSINFLALICLFVVYFVNFIYIKEEFIQIPEIKSGVIKNFIIPNEVKSNDYNFKILNQKDDKSPEKTKLNNSLSKKKIDDASKNLLEKQSNLKDDYKKFVVQLGVFKDKKNAEAQLLKIYNNKNKNNLFKDIKINLVKKKNKNSTLYYIETDKIPKKNAINLCNSYKEKKINCIIKIKK